MSNSKRPNAYPEAKTTMDVEALTVLFDGTSLEGLPAIKGAGISAPMLWGKWIESSTDWDTLVEKEEKFVLLRYLPHNLMTADMVTAEWSSETQLEILIRWPSLFSKVMRQVGFQSTGGQFQFDQGHDVFKSIAKYLVQRGEKEPIQPGKHSLYQYI